MADRIKVGVIGTGGIATLRHLPAYKEAEAAGKAEVVAVSDVVEASAQAAAAQFGVPHAFTDYRDLLQLPLDAVSICTPNSFHEPITLAALDAGMDVLCEKPLALDYAGARRMTERAEQTGRKTAVNFRYRWIPAAGFIRDLIAGGELGEIYHVYANYFNGSLHDPATPISWRQTRAESGSGALGDLASHIIDLCRWWIGEFASVDGHLRTFTTERPLTTGGVGPVDVDDAVSIHARFAGGAEGVINASRCAIGHNNHQRIELFGTKGALIYEIEKWDEGGDQIRICFGSGQARYNAFATVNVPPVYLLGTPQRVMTDFIDAIRAGIQPSPDFTDGMRCQEVLDAVELSDQEHSPVALPLAVGAA
ncbi:MAG TPA: Gfo/Idh/MocA family oxidoreductase [Thermomicrobiales bacterium]